MEQYFTREASQKPVRLKLKDLAGKETGDWIDVINRNSTAVRRASREAQRVMRDNIKNGMCPDEAFELASQLIQAAAIDDWSFEPECSGENRLRLVTEAPQIGDEINIVSAEDKRFFTNRSTH